MIKRKDFNKGATAIDKAGHEGREARGGVKYIKHNRGPRPPEAGEFFKKGGKRQGAEEG